jgi:preprotein translocase subunit SecG
LTTFLNVVWLLLSCFLILVILVQRGRGGGLVGALGGLGGSSAFGTRAGDVFTRITVVVFAVWLVLALGLVHMMKKPSVYTGGAEAADTQAVTAQPDRETGEKAAPTEPVKPETKKSDL